MNKIRTIGQFQERLDSEFAWRLKEIADVKTSVRTADGPRARTLIHAGIALLYAHWEGFVKAGTEHFVNYVSNRGLRYPELKPCFIVRGMRRHLAALTTPGTGKRTVEAAAEIVATLPNVAAIPFRDVINTKSNLNSEVFDDIAASVGIVTAPYLTKYNFIDESLLARRNRVAHGEYIDVGQNDYEHISDEVAALLRGYKTDLENAAALETYRA